ncbi:MAG: TolC family protein, partial [Paraglaciecola sp.]|nr:TolC family protein [Paraglaciecola sp.]
MSLITKFSIGLCLLLLSSLQWVNADTTQLKRSDSVTLSGLMQTLYEQHPAYQLDLTYQQQATANTNLANTLFAEPARVSVMHFNDVIGSSDGFQEWEAGVEMALWLPGQKQQQLELSEHLLAELPVQKQQVLLEISANIRKLVWDVAIAKVASDHAYHAWQLAQKLEKDVNIRVQAGDLAGTDGLLAKTHTLDMHSLYMEENATLEHHLYQYELITGEQVLPAHIDETLSDKNKIDQAHPMLAIYDQRIITLHTKQSLASYQDAAHPSVSVGMKRERGEGSESFNHSLGLGISFAFNDTVYRQPAIANAARDIADVQIARQRLEIALNSMLASSLQDLESKRQQLLLNEEHIETTQRYLVLQKRAFELGELALVTFLNSQNLAVKSMNRKQR